MSQPVLAMPADSRLLDERIELLKAEIKQQMTTVEQLKYDNHEYDDATRQLDIMLQRYSLLIQHRYVHP